MDQQSLKEDTAAEPRCADWRDRGHTRKIEGEASQKNQADETGRGRHRSAVEDVSSDYVHTYL